MNSEFSNEKSLLFLIFQISWKIPLPFTTQETRKGTRYSEHIDLVKPKDKIRTETIVYQEKFYI